jgi:hypothetical protein
MNWLKGPSSLLSRQLLFLGSAAGGAVGVFGLQQLHQRHECRHSGV